MAQAWKVVVAFAVVLALAAAGAKAAESIGEPVLEPATLHCLGVYWVINGVGKNTAVGVEYRPAGESAWRKGYPLFHVEKAAQVMEKFGSTVEVPDGAELFAGSIVQLRPDTAYEIRLTLRDGDKAVVEKVLSARTRGEPVIPSDARVRHVTTGQGGGSGTVQDPYRGLASAQAAARPGDVFLLHAGTYAGMFNVTRSGEPGKPIVWKSAGDGEVILDAQGSESRRPGRAISASGVHDVWFEGLTIRNADWGIVAHDSARIVVRRCHIHGCDYGLTATRDTKLACDGFFISDNVIEGPCTWPRTKGIENPRGIQLTGTGHIVCYNRIRGFSDAIDTFPSRRCSAIDFHNNDISECTDDGIEMDYSQRNTRCFNNRLTNVFQGISVQPVYGGPVYIFRNCMYNLGMETFKMHNSPSGALMLHNTSVKQGMPLLLQTSAPVHNSVYRNNLFVGTKAPYAYETTARMVNCDFDYDGFAGGPFGLFLKWNNKRYKAPGEAPVYRHAKVMDGAGLFASGVGAPEDVKKAAGNTVDLRLAAGSGAVDAGEVLPNFSDGYTGARPDLGACELGAELPHYGPRETARR